MTDEIIICRQCESPNVTNFDAEVNIHFSGLKWLNKPSIFVFPKLVVCLDCGLTEFDLTGAQMELLRDQVVSERITL
jgi:hypothetical protein